MECNFESGGQDAVASTRFDRPVKIAENYTSPENSDTRFTTKLIVRGRSFKHPLRYNQFCQFLCGCFQAPFANPCSSFQLNQTVCAYTKNSMNSLTDMNSGWWPFLHLRRELNQPIDNNFTILFTSPANTRWHFFWKRRAPAEHHFRWPFLHFGEIE